MKTNYILTLAITTYNATNHIDPLLNSLKALKNHREIKILFLDDASSDRTVEYIKSKTNDFKNVDIHIGKKNIGIAYLRNKGKELLQTDWIWYIDCDDNLINTSKINGLLNIAKRTKCNVIEFKYLVKNIDGIIKIPRIFKKIKSTTGSLEFSINDTKNMPIVDFPWNRIIHISLLKKIPWYDTYNEDTQFAGVLYSLGSFVFYNNFLYSYNTRYYSISRRPGYSKLVNENIIIFLRYMLKNNLEYREEYIITSIFILLIRMHLLTKKEFKEVKKLFGIYKKKKLMIWYFNYDNNHKLFYIFLKLKLFFLIRLILKFRNRNIE